MEQVFYKNKGLIMKPRIDEKVLKELLTRNIEGLRAVNFNEEYIASVVTNLKKWAETGLLAGMSDPYISKNVATLFENQRLWNERIDDDFAQIKRISIPMVRRVFADNFIGYQLVSVQALKANENAHNVYSSSFEGKTIQHTIETGIRQIGDENVFSEGIDESGYSLSKEAEFVAQFAEDTANELGREIIRDLAINAGKSAVYEYKDEDYLMSLVEGMSSYIAAKCFRREATWIMTSPAIVKLLEDKIEFREDFVEGQKGLNCVGVLKKENSSWRLFEDSEANPGHILLGLKDPHNHFFAGYIFSPIITVNPMAEDKKIVSHYGKRLLNPNFYGIIKIENLPEVSNLEETTEEDSEGEAE